MLEPIRYMIKLQILQDRKVALLRSHQKTPQRMTELEKDYQRFEAEYLVKKAEHDHALEMHRSLERSVADQEARIARSKNRMTEVKTNKEYHAILKEIEDMKRDISAKEDQALEYMENIESLGRELKVLEESLHERKQQLDRDLEELRSQSEVVQEQLDRLEAMQDKVRDHLPNDLLRRCDAMLRRASNVAVAAVEKGVCQICHMNIPPQKFIELQRDEAILQCPHCHCFIYWPGHEAYQVYDEELEELAATSQDLGREIA